MNKNTAANKSTRNTATQTRHMKEAGVLAELFSHLSAQLAVGDVAAARSASHRAHALLEVLSAMDAQDEHSEFASPKCEERRQAADAWKRLMRPTAETAADLHNHFAARRFSHIRLQPSPPLPAAKPRDTYKGGIYQTVFLPDDPKLAKQLGLPDSYTFRHGVTNAGFQLSLHWAIERKLQTSQLPDTNVRSESGLRAGSFNTLCVSKRRRYWEDDAREVHYSVHSTTHAGAAAWLAAERSGKRKENACKDF